MGKVKELVREGKGIVNDTIETVEMYDDHKDRVRRRKKDAIKDKKENIRCERVERTIYNLLKNRYKNISDYNKLKTDKVLLIAATSICLIHPFTSVIALTAGTTMLIDDFKFNKVLNKRYELFLSIFEDSGLYTKMKNDAKYIPCVEELDFLVNQYKLVTDCSLINILHYKFNNK